MCSATNVPSVVSTQKRPAGAPGGPFCVIAWISCRTLSCFLALPVSLQPKLGPLGGALAEACGRTRRHAGAHEHGHRWRPGPLRGPGPHQREPGPRALCTAGLLAAGGTTADCASGLSFSAFDGRSRALSPGEAHSGIMIRFMRFACGRRVAGLSLAGW